MWTKPAEGVDDVEEDPVTLVARTEFPTKATHAQTRAHNAGLVLRAVYDLGPISRAEIEHQHGSPFLRLSCVSKSSTEPFRSSRSTYCARSVGLT